MDVERTFFVTGLPRSRTAWFSEWLPNCLHEGMEGCYTRTEYINKLKGGDSSSALMFFPLKDYFPDSPVVIVERDMNEVVSSLSKIGLFNDDIYKMLQESRRRLDKMDGLRVDYHNLNYEDIWIHLIGHGFDKHRTEIMKDMNIQKVNYKPNVEALISLVGES
jgi:hypothetical protein